MKKKGNQRKRRRIKAHSDSSAENDEDEGEGSDEVSHSFDEDILYLITTVLSVLYCRKPLPK